MRSRFNPGIRLLGMFLVLGAFLAVGCGDATLPEEPSPSDPGVVGNLDPSQQTFLLREIQLNTQGGERVSVRLLGSNLRVDPVEETVMIDVAIENASNFDLYPPAEIWISGFSPPSIRVLNGYDPCVLIDPLPGEDCNIGVFSYEELIGDDGILSAGETSQAREWAFSDPGLFAFSFSADAYFELEPVGPRIAGFAFNDENRNGRREPNESLFGGGWVRASFPDGSAQEHEIEESGHYSILVTVPGLYAVEYLPPPTFAPLVFTTPNPLEILLPPGPNGLPVSFLDANFGVTNALGGPPPIVLTDRPADEIEQDFYHFLDIGIDGHLLELHVGFSGCGPEHDFTLYMVGGFMESNPVQARLLLAHDDMGELCDAYFERVLLFDLGPMLESYREGYGRLDPIILRFSDFLGQVHTVTFEP